VSPQQLSGLVHHGRGDSIRSAYTYRFGLNGR
jgi:hypothetical protein